MKTCSKCNKNKDTSEFRNHPKTLDGLQAWCNSCLNAYSTAYRLANKPKYAELQKKWRLRNPEKSKQHRKNWALGNQDKIRRYSIRKYKNMDEAIYQQMLQQQEGKCAICNSPETQINHRTGKALPLSVDHNHQTGAVRGLLCHRCNTGIGLFNENLVYLQGSIDYLIKHKNPL